jgi:hypothetical protein
MPDLKWAAWNQALTDVAFVCALDVVEVAYRLDEALWRTDWVIRGGETGQDAWLWLRRPASRGRRLPQPPRISTLKRSATTTMPDFCRCSTTTRATSCRAMARLQQACAGRR